MQSSTIIKEIETLKISKIANLVSNRIQEFILLNSKNDDAWFSELCFCILTANSKAISAIAIQNELGPEGFISASEDKIKNIIIKKKHRFHNNKTKYIMLARKFKKIKKHLEKFNNSIEKRKWLVMNIKGLGYKEASHFLRNTGHFDVAILDRHIINTMVEKEFINAKPKTLSQKTYLFLEKKLSLLCNQVLLNQAELDLYLWYLKTGKILK